MKTGSSKVFGQVEGRRSKAVSARCQGRSGKSARSREGQSGSGIKRDLGIKISGSSKVERSQGERRPNKADIYSFSTPRTLPPEPTPYNNDRNNEKNDEKNEKNEPDRRREPPPSRQERGKKESTKRTKNDKGEGRNGAAVRIARGRE